MPLSAAATDQQINVASKPPTPGDHPDGAIEYAPPAPCRTKAPLATGVGQKTWRWSNNPLMTCWPVKFDLLALELKIAFLTSSAIIWSNCLGLWGRSRWQAFGELESGMRRHRVIDRAARSFASEMTFCQRHHLRALAWARAGPRVISKAEWTRYSQQASSSALPQSGRTSEWISQIPSIP